VRELVLKRLLKMPPVLLRVTSFVDWDLGSAGDRAGDLMLVRRVDGLEDTCPLLGSRADMLLRTVSVYRMLT
jgi:hypothetical protein